MRVRLLDETGTTNIRCWYDIGKLVRVNGTVASLRKKIASEFNLHADSIGFEVEGFDLLDDALLVNILRDEDIIRLKHFKSGPLKRLVNAATSLFRVKKRDTSSRHDQDLDRKPSVSSHLKAITSGLGKRKRRQDDTAVHKRIKSKEQFTHQRHIKHEQDSETDNQIDSDDQVDSDDQIDSDDAIQDVLNDPYGTDPDFDPDVQDDDEDINNAEVTLSRSLSLPHPPRHKTQKHPRSASAVEYLHAKTSQQDESDEEESDEQDSDENLNTTTSDSEDSLEDSSNVSASSSSLSHSSEEESSNSGSSSVYSESDSDPPTPQKNIKRHTLSLPVQAPPGQGKAKTKARNRRKRRKRQALSQSVQSHSPDGQDIKAEVDHASTSENIHQHLNIRPTAADLGNKKKKKSFLKGQTERVGQHVVFDEDVATSTQVDNRQPPTSTISAVISAVELEDLRYAPPQVGPEIMSTPDRQWKPASSVNSFKKRVRKLASMDDFGDSPAQEEIIVQNVQIDPIPHSVDVQGDACELVSKDGKSTLLAMSIDDLYYANRDYYFGFPFHEVRDRDNTEELPQGQDVIAFKMMELGPNYTPRISEFKIGIVETLSKNADGAHHNAEDVIYNINLLHENYKPHREKLTFDRDGRVKGGKFEMTDDSETNADDLTLVVTWKEMHDVYIMREPTDGDTDDIH